MFTLTLEHQNGDKEKLTWNPFTLDLMKEDGTQVDLSPLQRFYQPRMRMQATQKGEHAHEVAERVHPTLNPLGKSRFLKNVRIIFGLACNFSCSYCSQAAARNADDKIGETTDVDEFLEKLPNWLHTTPDQEIRFEFWGGESLVYWKKIKAMAEKLRVMYPKAYFWLPTNGSLMTREMNKWLFDLDFHIAFSHDGPGQHHRSPDDPLDDPESLAAILEFCDKKTPEGKFNINTVMTYGNHSYYDLYEFFSKKFAGHQYPTLSCEGLVLAHSASDIDRSPDSPQTHLDIRKQLMADMLIPGMENISFVGYNIGEFAEVLIERQKAESHGQGCGLDRKDNITLKLNGDVVICPNGSAPDQKIGSVHEFDDIQLKTTHWSYRDGCNSCPVMPLCKGACMMFDGEKHHITCDNHFTYHMTHFAYTLYCLTGALLTKIEGEQIRFSEIKEFDYWEPCEIRPKQNRPKSFPVRIVTEKTGCPTR